MTVNEKYSLNGSSVLLLGATGGIGSALARELAGRGSQLCCVGTNTAKLAALEPASSTLAADLRSPEACKHAVDFAVEKMSKLDVVVNAVGVVAFGPVTDLSVEAMEDLFMVNTFIPIMIANAALPRISADGALVNISGVIAEKNLPHMATYGASKAATKSFDEALAREARRMSVRVLDARPPHTESGLADHPIEGSAPKMPQGISTEAVAKTICDALEAGTTDLPSTAFG